MRWGDWVNNRELTWAQAAQRIGAANSMVAWRLANGAIPRRAIMARIYLATRGQVTPNDFYDLPALPGPEPQEEAA